MRLFERYPRGPEEREFEGYCITQREVLEFLYALRQPASLTMLFEIISRDKREAFGIVKGMERSGLIQKSGTRYVLGPHTARLMRAGEDALTVPEE